MENDYFQFKAGTFDSETWDAYVNSFREDTFKNTALRVMWKLMWRLESFCYDFFEIFLYALF